VKYVTDRVTQEDIDARTYGPSSCPIARALRRVGYEKPYVGWGMWSPNGLTGWSRTSRRARRFISTYDARGNVQPATFRLPLP
jgi:hypothetical protein